MSPDLIRLEASSEKDPDGKRLEAALNAHLAFERAQQRRLRFVHLLALASVPVFASSVWPEWLSPSHRTMVQLAWVACAGLALTAFFRELQWGWRRDMAAAAPGRPEGPGAAS